MPIIVKTPQEQHINEHDQVQQEVSDYVKSMIEMTAEYEEQQQHHENDNLSKPDKIEETGNEKKN